MSKHTPGPWQVGTKHHHNACQVYAADGQDAVCMVYDIWLHRNVDECKDCKGMANARLIAAAPELYAELYNQVKNCPSCKGTGTSVDIMVFVMDGTHAEADCLRCMGARKALAKAEGKQ